MNTIARSILVLTLIALAAVPAVAGKRNPFSRPGFLMADEATGKKQADSAPDVALANLKLTGIINGTVAMINHAFYHKGDRIGLFTVAEIHPNKVVLEHNGARYDLVLNIKLIQIKKE